MKKLLSALMVFTMIFSVYIPAVNADTASYAPYYRFEVEDGALTGATVKADSLFSYSGGGYVLVSNGTITLTVNVPGGKYTVYVVSSSDDANSKCDYIEVNSGTQYLVSSPEYTGNWAFSQPGAENWYEGLKPLPPAGGFTFNTGVNTVKITTNWGSCAYDCVILVPEVSVPYTENDSLTYELETAALDFFSGAYIVNHNDDFSDFGGFGYVFIENGQVQMKIDVPKAGKYKFFISSASALNDARCEYVSVNGGTQYLIASPSYDGEWHSSQPGTQLWVDNVLTPAPPAEGFWFSEGVNTVDITANWGNCAYDSITLVRDDNFLSGMFVVPDLVAPLQPDGKTVWSQTQWNSAALSLKEAGMDKLIIQYSSQYWSHANKTFFYNQTFTSGGAQPYYQQQQISYALAAAKANGMKVYLGLQIAEDMWFSNMSDGFTDAGFLTASETFSENLAANLWHTYSGQYADTIEGWYLTFELNNREVPQAASQRMISGYFAPVTAYLKTLTPGKPIMISPFVISRLGQTPSPAELGVWKSMCKSLWEQTDLDIIAPQDGCGWEWNVRETLVPWYSALYDAMHEANVTRELAGKPAAQIWNNAESYNMNGVNQMPVKRLLANIDEVRDYVSLSVSFSLHYFVPLPGNTCGVDPDNQKYYDAYKYAYDHSEAYTPESPIPAPVNGTAQVTGGVNALLSWSAVPDTSLDMPVTGYMVKRKSLNKPDSEAIKISELRQSDGGTVSFTDNQIMSGHAYEYLIYSFDATGNRSLSPLRIDVPVSPTGTENNRLYGGSIASGKAVTLQNLYGIQYDSAGGLLTDGIIGGRIANWGADRPKWVGAQKPGASEGRYSMTVQLPSNTASGFAYLGFLYQPELEVCLPEKIEAYSHDNTLLCTVYPKALFGNPVIGNVWIPVDLGGAVNTQSLKFIVTQSDRWTMVSEISVYEADELPFEGIPENLAAGQLTEITADGGADPEKLRGVKETVYDSQNGYYDSYVTQNSNYATKNLTRTAAAPYLDWWGDATQSQWLGVIATGTSCYSLKVNLSEPSKITSLTSRWLEDNSASIFIPKSVEYYGQEQGGALIYLGTAQKCSVSQLDWTKPVDNINSHSLTETDMTVFVDDGRIYSSVIARVYPHYTNAWTYSRNLAVYNFTPELLYLKDSVTAGMKVGELCANLTGDVYCYENGQLAGGLSTVKTGMRLKIAGANNAVVEKRLVLFGDTNGDGEISVRDLVAVKRHMVGLEPLECEYLEAALKNSGAVTVNSITDIKRKILGLE